jgi:hypothetical protein
MSTETLDFAMNFDDGQQNEADKKLLVIFYRDVQKNENKSTEQGRPIFDEIDVVKIISPGQRDSFVGDATEQYQQRFPQQWARYKAGREQGDGSGTPLNMLPWMSMSAVAEFKALNCHTIEQLVGMPDSVSQRFMGHHQIKQRAQAYLDAAKDSAPLLKLNAELQKRDEQLQQQNELISAMKERLEQLETRSIKA